MWQIQLAPVLLSALCPALNHPCCFIPSVFIIFILLFSELFVLLQSVICSYVLQRIGKKYGFSPKFVRMQVMHQFLFYLIYGYTGSENLDQEAIINRLRQRNNSVTDEIAEEMATIYSEDVDWKMFVPPLPTHAGNSV
jgi:hypothetical protein